MDRLDMKNTLLTLHFIFSFLLMTSSGMVSAAKNDFQFNFQPNPRDQLQKITETPQRLIEKHARNAGLGNVRVTWMKFPNGEKMNKALETGFLDIASGGVVPLVSAWDRTRGAVEVKGLAAISTMPVYLNSRNPAVKDLKDFTDKDRIALPAPGTSLQAVLLQMAVAKEFGRMQATKLDHLTLGMPHPDAASAMLSGDSKVTSHFASPPFQYREIDHPEIHKVLSSYDVMGGPATFTVLWSSKRFVSTNPHTARVVYRALQEAIEIIRKDLQYAATIYVQQGNKIDWSEEDIHKILSLPDNGFNAAPLNVMKVAEFMYQTGKISKRPAGWESLFFEYVRGLPGS
jgi:NitT/TauT family transport system substrate-binding protein